MDRCLLMVNPRFFPTFGGENKSLHLEFLTGSFIA